MSFQYQDPIVPVYLEIIDVTPVLILGEQRDGIFFPQGYLSPKFRRTEQIGGIDTLLTPRIRSVGNDLDERVKAARRWYAKGLAAFSDVDRFTFFWICIEILCSQSTVSVRRPYIASCGHEIAKCPECQTPTDREVNGQTIKRYLTERAGLSSTMAAELWRMRQMFHGANQLTVEANVDLPRLMIELRSTACRLLKESLGFGSDELPYSYEHHVGINSAIWIGGKKTIVEEDLILSESI